MGDSNPVDQSERFVPWPLVHLPSFYMHLYSGFISIHTFVYICVATSSLSEEGRTGASLTVGRVTSGVMVLTRTDRAQPSCPQFNLTIRARG